MSKNTFLHLLAIVLITTLNVNATGRCPAYCDENNHLTSPIICDISEYCCGSDTERFCCSNQLLDSGHEHDDLCGCPNVRCEKFRWNAWNIVVIVFSVVVVILAIYWFAKSFCGRVTDCDCLDMFNLFSQPASTARVGSTDLETISHQLDGSQNPPSFHQVVLAPPDYDTVCAGLPKYEELFSEGSPESGLYTAGGLVNPACLSTEEIQTSSRNTVHVQVRTNEDTSLRHQDLSTNHIRQSDTPPPPYDNHHAN